MFIMAFDEVICELICNDDTTPQALLLFFDILMNFTLHRFYLFPKS